MNRISKSNQRIASMNGMESMNWISDSNQRFESVIRIRYPYRIKVLLELRERYLWHVFCLMDIRVFWWPWLADEKSRALLATWCSFCQMFAGVTCDHGLLWNIKASNVKAPNVKCQPSTVKASKHQMSKRPLRGSAKRQNDPVVQVSR